MLASTSQAITLILPNVTCTDRMLTMAKQPVAELGWDPKHLAKLQTVLEPAALLHFEWCRKQWWKTATVVVPTLTESGKSRGEIQLNWAEFTHLRRLFFVHHLSPKYYRAKSQTSPGWLRWLPSLKTQVVAQCHPAAHIHTSTRILCFPPPLSLSEPFLAFQYINARYLICTFPSLICYLQAAPPSLFAVMEE